jgi:hypothetical protein
MQAKKRPRHWEKDEDEEEEFGESEADSDDDWSSNAEWLDDDSPCGDCFEEGDGFDDVEEEQDGDDDDDKETGDVEMDRRNSSSVQTSSPDFLGADAISWGLSASSSSSSAINDNESSWLRKGDLSNNTKLKSSASGAVGLRSVTSTAEQLAPGAAEFAGQLHLTPSSASVATPASAMSTPRSSFSTPQFQPTSPVSSLHSNGTPHTKIDSIQKSVNDFKIKVQQHKNKLIEFRSRNSPGQPHLSRVCLPSLVLLNRNDRGPRCSWNSVSVKSLLSRLS